MTVDDISVVLKPSKVWKQFRSTVEGQISLKQIMHKVLTNIRILLYLADL